MPIQYEVRTAWYNYTRRDGTTYAGILLSRNGTKKGRYMVLACDVTPCVRLVSRAAFADSPSQEMTCLHKAGVLLRSPLTISHIYSLAD